VKTAQEVTIFQHIPKTAGTTMRSFLRAVVPPTEFLECVIHSRVTATGNIKTPSLVDPEIDSFIDQLWRSRNTVSCIAANLPFGLHGFIDRPARYVALVREPVDRCISYWYYAYDRRDVGPLWRALESRRFNLEIILNDPETAPYFVNDQTRYLSGSHKLNVNREIFEEALHNVNTRYSFCGTFENDLTLLEKFFQSKGSSTAALPRLNVGKKSDASLLPSGAPELFASANNWDRLLWYKFLREPHTSQT
jgi:hypothetical protein